MSESPTDQPELSGPEFSGLRAYVWPVHYFELKKLLPMLLIFFLLNFDYNVLRTMKDALVVTAKSSGAEVIPFIKVWVMFPGAILMTYLFTHFSNRYKQETVFYSIFGLFLVYFFTFAFILYPIRETLHADRFADYLQTVLPVGCKGFIAMIRYWLFTTFYVMSELWSNIILFLLFWGFANQITHLKEAKRFYGLFGIGANASGVAAGCASVYFCQQAFNPYIPLGNDAWEQSMMILIVLILLAGIAAIGIYRWMHVSILTDKRFYNPQEAKENNQIKGKMSMRENFSHLFKSPYLFYLAVIVISYNLVINLVEVLWKHEVRELYPNPQDYALYMNHITAIIGLIATFAAIFISGNSIRKCGWTFTALLTPTILLFTSIGFFGFFFFKEQASLLTMTIIGTTPLAITVFFGSAQNIMSRAAKYTVFDSTQQMAFIPLDPELKLRGKAAIDGVCSRLGKSAGSVIHQTLLLTFSTIPACAPYVAAALLGTISIWTLATFGLGRKFQQLTQPEVRSLIPKKLQEQVAN